MSNKSDFKISFAKNDYEIRMYSLFSDEPKIIKLDNMTDWEISYHRSDGDNPPVIHMKEKRQDTPEYITLPMTRLIDPKGFIEFPIPFMKIQIPNDFQAKNYKHINDKSYINFDLDEANVAEIYLTNPKYDFSYFEEKWPTIDLSVLTKPFEAFATNNIVDDNKFLNFFPSNNESRKITESFDINKNCNFFINIYHDPNVEDGPIKVTFIENQYAVSLMGLSAVRIPKQNGEMETMCAFVNDLNKNTMDIDEKKKWWTLFELMEHNLKFEMRKIKSANDIR